MVSLALDGVGVRYGRREVLGGVTVPTLEGGTLTAVIGPNAAGKSSLFKRIAGLADGPGTVRLGGDDDDDAGSIRYMPQDTSANAVLTLYESVVLAAKLGSTLRVSDEELARIDKILRTLRIADIAFRNLGELSGGQRQLAAIAQALVRRPRVLLMDEPTAALDLHRQMEVLSLMRDLAARDRMVVLIAIHDLDHALRFCASTLVVADGRMIACGRSSEIITADLLRDVYRVEGRIERCSRGMPRVLIDGPLRDGAPAADGSSPGVAAADRLHRRETR